jgi:aldehyde:ferredoxin oxidoreductase
MSILGDIITINLTTREITRLPISDDVARQVMGGRGLNVWLMQQQPNLLADPFGPDNELLLSNGLLTGTVAPSSSRLQFAARSPQTGFLGTSNIGGHFGAALRKVGVQTVRVIGQSPVPVYVWIDGEKVEICDAAPLWGLDVPPTVEAIKAAHPDQPDLHILSIGTGGENRVRFAAIIADDGHAAGRTGLGAVMGAKNLKAMVVPATPGSRTANAEMSELAKDYTRAIRASERYEIYSKYSNGVYLRETNDLGLLGTRNFRQVQFEKVNQLDAKEFMKYVHKHKTCHRCPVHCKAEVRIEHGRFEKMIGERPDIEPLMGFGPRIGVADLEAVLYLFNLTNELGIDSISAAGVIAFAMDLYEQEIISIHDTGGMPLRWGDVEAAIVLLHQIARREGFGAVLAEGVLRAAQHIGPEAKPYAHHSKGLELPGYDPRGAQGTALAFAISSRGADYASVYPSLEWFWTSEQGEAAFGSADSVNPLKTKGKGRMVKHSYTVSAALDVLGVCKVPVLSVLGDFSLENEARFVSTYTGWTITPADLFTLGAQIITGERRLNMAMGLTSADDRLNAKFLTEPAPSGPGQGQVVQLDEMLREYYEAMGWDEQGRPR